MENGIKFNRGIEVGELIARLQDLIDAKEDDVRFYLVPAEPRGGWQGPLPSSALFSVSASPAATLARRLARQEGVRSEKSSGER
jgi:hypothetical protein